VAGPKLLTLSINVRHLYHQQRQQRHPPVAVRREIR